MNTVSAIYKFQNIAIFGYRLILCNFNIQYLKIITLCTQCLHAVGRFS